MTRSPGWRLPALLAALFLIGVLAPATAAAQPAPAGHLVGHLTGQDGQPVAGASVYAYDAAGQQYRGMGTTGHDGSYVIGSLAPGEYKVQFRTPDFRRSQWAHQQHTFDAAQSFTVVDGQSTTVDEVLLPTGTLVVRVVDEVTGAPVQSFYAEAWIDGSGGNGNTETGAVTMTDLLVGEYRVTAYPDQAHFDARGTATVVANQTTEVVLTARPAGVLETTLVDAATGAPVENACITTVGELEIVGYILNCTGPDGRITAGGLESGSYRIFAKPRDEVHGAQWVGFGRGVGSRYLAKQFEVRAGQTTTVPPIRLDLAGTITGRVTDAATGAPVAAMCAYPYATSTDAGPETGPHCSDENGAYTVTGLGPYYWPMEFVGDWSNQQYAWHWSGGRPNQLVAHPTKVTVGQTATLDTALVPGATLRGRVLDANGNPVFGSVHVRNALTGDPAAAYGLTDENGYYEVPALSGQFVRVEFWAAYPDDRHFWYRDASGFHDARPVWVPAGGTTTGIDFTVPNA